MWVGRILLGLAALTFIGIGMLYLISPDVLKVYAGTPSAAQLTEVRAVYGGLELGLGLFFAWSVSAAQRRSEGLLLLGLVLAGLTLGRILGWTIEGSIDTVNFWAGMGEGGGAAAAWWAWHHERRARR